MSIMERDYQQELRDIISVAAQDKDFWVESIDYKINDDGSKTLTILFQPS